MAHDHHSTTNPQVDYYEILDVSSDATPNAIQRAYRQKAKELHPDLNPTREEWAKNQFQRLNDAYTILSDKDARQKYDTLRWRFNVYSINPTDIYEEPEVEPVTINYTSINLGQHLLAMFSPSQTLIMMIVLLGAIAIPVYFGFIKPTQDAVATNAEFGTKSNPIPHNRVITLGDFTVQIEHPIYQANTKTQNANIAIGRPEEGSQFVLIKMHVTCHKTECAGNELRMDVLDWNNKSWGQPNFSLLRGSLGYATATEGNTMSGWVLFEMPLNAQIQMVRFWYLGGPIIYAYPAT